MFVQEVYIQLRYLTPSGEVSDTEKFEGRTFAIMGDPGFVYNGKIHRELTVRLSEFKKEVHKTYLNEASSLAINGVFSEMGNT